MASFIKDPSFAPQLFEYLSQQIAAQPRRVRALREYLNGKRSWTKTSTAVDECISNDSTPSLAIRRRIIDTMDNYGADLQSLYAPILLAWGLHQDWALEVNAKTLLHHWAQTNLSNSTAACCHATAFLTQMVAVQQEVPSIWRQQVFADVIEAMLVFTNTWRPSSLPSIIASNFLVSLGYAVQVCPSAQQGSKESLLSQCTRYTQVAINGAGLQTQRSISTALIRSELPGQYKLDVHHGANVTLWSMALNTFLPLLPPDEIERFNMLPFDEPEEPVAEMDAWTKEGYIESNNNIVRQYCPQMHPILALVTTPDDWCQRARIQALVDRFNALNAQEFELPEGVVSQTSVNTSSP